MIADLDIVKVWRILRHRVPGRRGPHPRRSDLSMDLGGEKIDTVARCVSLLEQRAERRLVEEVLADCARARRARPARLAAARAFAEFTVAEGECLALPQPVRAYVRAAGLRLEQVGRLLDGNDDPYQVGRDALTGRRLLSAAEWSRLHELVKRLKLEAERGAREPLAAVLAERLNAEQLNGPAKIRDTINEEVLHRSMLGPLVQAAAVDAVRARLAHLTRRPGDRGDASAMSVGLRRMSDKPLDPALAEALLRIKAELRADLGKGLAIGAKAWSQQTNDILGTVSARLARLESKVAPNKKR